MIQASDLRIGNLIFSRSRKIGTVDEIVSGDAGHDYEKIVRFKELNLGGGYGKDLNPIPLTPDILEKCGFEKGKWGGYVKDNMLWSFDVLIMCDGEILIKCKYLHQLQNITHTITGQELTINL